MRESLFEIASYHHHHHHHHDVATAHSVRIGDQWFLDLPFYGRCCRRRKKKEKKNPILFPLILWLCHRIISVVPYSWTEPLWLPPDCVLSVAAPLCFCRLFLCALNRCLWICGLIFLWWGFGSNGRRGTCNGGMDGVDLVPSPISTVCPLWSGYFEALSLWLMNDFLVPQKNK